MSGWLGEQDEVLEYIHLATIPIPDYVPYDDDEYLKAICDMEENNGISELQPTPKDIASFKAVLQKKLEIFLERRQKYGNHLDNAKRFPKEHRYALYLKCVRAARMIEDGIDPDEDTLLDFSNYADMLTSTIMESKCTGG